jgi:hypothetical protein
VGWMESWRRRLDVLSNGVECEEHAAQKTLDVDSDDQVGKKRQGDWMKKTRASYGKEKVETTQTREMLLRWVRFWTL